jgi:hypothetical protein
MLRAIALHDCVTIARDGLSDLYQARNPGVKIRTINSVTSAFDFMSRKQKARSGNPDLRRATQVPAPEIAEIEAKLWYWLSPESFKPLSLTPGDKKLRDRLLTDACHDGSSIELGIPQDSWFK